MLYQYPLSNLEPRAPALRMALCVCVVPRHVPMCVSSLGLCLDELLSLPAYPMWRVVYTCLSSPLKFSHAVLPV